MFSGVKQIYKFYKSAPYIGLRLEKILNGIPEHNFTIYRPFSSELHIVEMRGLDCETTEQDVVDYFKPLGIMPKKVYLKRDGAGRAAGISEIEFSTHAEAVVAMRKKNAFMGNRFIRLTLKSIESDSNLNKGADDVKNQLQSSAKVTLTDTENSGRPLQTGHSVRMKNIPRRMTDQAIYDFFWPVGVQPISVKPIYNESGLRTGEFDVQFLTENDALRAMAKNNAYLCKKFVELSLNTAEYKK